MNQPQVLDAKQIENLVEKAKTGDTDAFGIIFDHFIDEIFKFSLVKVGNKDDAQDIASETFSRAWSYLSRYKTNNFRAYLYTIARNLCYDFYKKNAKSENLSIDFDLPDMSINMEDSLIDNEQSERLMKAISKLPENYKDIIILRFINGLSVKETAKAIGMSGGAARTAQHRAIQKLKELLKA